MITQKRTAPEKGWEIYAKKVISWYPGVLELKNDSQEVVKYEAVHADADIYIKRQKAYYHEIPLNTMRRI